MVARSPSDIPSEVSAVEGDVLVDGPEGIAVAFTPDAAIETSHRLLDGGLTAQGQRRQRANDEGGKGQD